MFRILFCLILVYSALTFADDFHSIDDIENTVQDALMHYFSDDKTSTYHLQVGPLSSHLHLALCDDSLNIDVDESRLNQSQISVKASCLSKKWSVRVPVKIQQLKTVVVASKHLSKGETLSADAVSLKSYNVKLIRESYFETIEDVNNMVLQRSIPEGTVLTNYMIKKPLLIHRGEPVKIICQSAGIRIESLGIAQTDGIVDQMIKVKNTRSNLFIDAMVKDRGVVVVPM